MTDTQAVRAALVAERDRVAEQLRELGIDRDSFDEGFADSGQVMAERGEVVQTLRETEADVAAAIAKLEAGDFGRCEECGEVIGEARLEAVPWARRCIGCASRSR
mgnify:CR=1 FL=1